MSKNYENLRPNCELFPQVFEFFEQKRHINSDKNHRCMRSMTLSSFFRVCNAHTNRIVQFSINFSNFFAGEKFKFRLKAVRMEIQVQRKIFKLMGSTWYRQNLGAIRNTVFEWEIFEAFETCFCLEIDF